MGYTDKMTGNYAGQAVFEMADGFPSVIKKNTKNGYR